MENSHSETRLILSLSLQDIDNLAKDLKPRQRMFRFFSHADKARYRLQHSDGTGRCFAFRAWQGMELQPQYRHPFPEGTGGRRTRQGKHG